MTNGIPALVAHRPGSPPARNYGLSFAANRLRPASVSFTLRKPFSSSHLFPLVTLTARSTSSWSFLEDKTVRGRMQHGPLLERLGRQEPKSSDF